MVCLLAFCGLTLPTAFAAAENGNCLNAATSLSISTTEMTTAVTLVRGWNQYDGEWSGETEEDSEYVQWYKVSLTKGKPYVFWTTDTSNENIFLSVEPNYNLDPCPYTYFNCFSIGEDHYYYVATDGWHEEDPSTCTFYVRLTGGYYSGKTITLHCQQADINDVLPIGTRDNPELLDVPAPGTAVVRKTPGKSGEYFFRVTLAGDVKYKFVCIVENGSTVDVEVKAVDGSYNTGTHLIEGNKLDFTIEPDKHGDYIIHFSENDELIRFWLGDRLWMDDLEIDVETTSIDGVWWSYFVRNEEAFVVDAAPTHNILRIPSVLDEYSVKGIGRGAFGARVGLTRVIIPNGVEVIGNEAFSGCSALTSMDIPQSVTNIGYKAFTGCDAITSVTIPACVTQLRGVFPSYQSITNVVVHEGPTCIPWYAFSYCAALMNITLPESITSIEEEAFCGCSSLKRINIPSSVTSIDSEAFYKCANLKNLNFAGDAPDMGINVFYGTPRSLVINVGPDALGWDDYTYMGEMPPWGLRKVNGLGTDSGDDPIPSDHEFNLTITNVIVHYVLNSVQPEIAVPVSGDTGFVAVITEVTSTGAVSVPSEWKGNYPSFESKFGTDFGKALMSQTGKKDCANNDMLVWQDFVAGTDPTNPDDKFTASITLVDGVPVISYTPELSDEQKALRTYKTFGKKQLQDKDWTDVSNLDGELMRPYNFFKVTVEMK